MTPQARAALRADLTDAVDAVKALTAENGKLRACLRVNALRWCPGLSHAEIDDMIAKAIDGPALDQSA